MDYEKAYKEALERARKCWGEYNELVGDFENKGVCEEIFPELAESEDEKIRKSLLGQYKRFKPTDYYDDGITFGDVVSWLEKQGDKDKLIKELGEYKVKYTQEVLEKHINSMSNKDDERLRKTTIAFLKDFAEQGYENAAECIDWLEKQGEQKSVVIPKFRIGDIIRWKKADSVEYTIKEINDKGYINTANGIMDISQTDIEFELVEQKPTDEEMKALLRTEYEKGRADAIAEFQKEWSEEDEAMLKRVIDFIPQCMTAHGYNEYINWLKSLKDRYTWKPSENELEVLRIVAEKDGTCLMGLYEQLKQL